jgi:hypothetical protein
VDAKDLTVEVINGKDIVFLMPQEVADKIADQTNSKYFIHGWSWNDKDKDTPPAGIERAKYLFDVLTKTDLRSTVDRWATGINTRGQSSERDGKAVGANYVYTTKSSSTGGMFSFDARKMLRRVDYYLNVGDGYGQKSEKDTLQLLAGSVHEILFKGTISWADLAYINVDSQTRTALIELLTQSGVTDFGGTPLNTIFGVK